MYLFAIDISFWSVLFQIFYFYYVISSHCYLYDLDTIHLLWNYLCSQVLLSVIENNFPPSMAY